MAKKKKAEEAFVSANAAVKAIKKLLEQNTAIGRRLPEVFDDWIALSVAALWMQPQHLWSLRLHGRLADDPADVADLWARMRSIYSGSTAGPGPYFERFKAALAILERTAEMEWRDTLGDLYMEIGCPNSGAGQFFTPFELAKMMAQISCTGMIDLVYTRLREAIAKAEGAADFIAEHDLAATAAGDDAWVWEDLLPLIWPQFEPVTICDPCVGSGVVLLAAGSTMPRWITAWGMVQLYGQDIDHTCTQMAHINSMIYGLNGYGLRCKLASGEDIRPASGEVDWSALFGQAEQTRAGEERETADEFEEGTFPALLAQLQFMVSEPEPKLEPVLVEVPQPALAAA